MTASRPLVSVVLPTFNRIGTLGCAIESVLAQTYKNIELIVVDDGSSDGTREFVGGIKDSRLRYLRNETNAGVSESRNLGIRSAKGEWVAFQDSDDEWRLHKLELQVAAVRAGTVLVLCGDIFMNEPSMSFLGSKRAEYVVDARPLLPIRIPGAPTFLARRETLVTCKGFDSRLSCYEDWELALRLSDYGSVLLVNEPLVLCRNTPGGLYSAEAGRARNLKLVLAWHGDRVRTNRRAWASYCNQVGQLEATFGSMDEARSWFLRSIRETPQSPRSWANLVFSLFGRALFRRYVVLARKLRAGLAPPIYAA